MNYLLITSIAFILVSYANFMTLIFRIRLNETFLITICSIIIFSYFLFKLDIYYNLLILDYFFLILLSSAFFLLPILIKNNSKINKHLNLEFLFFFFLIFILSKERYYLDQDEFSYWGLALKNLILRVDGFNFAHHPDGLNLFRNLFIFFQYNEGNIIFSNNIILISGFYYLFYDRKLIFLEKIILFTIYYLLLNNLSFGFLSIYSDPILAVLYACLLKKSYFMFKDIDSPKEINFLLILFTLLLIKRSAPIYAIFIFYFCLSLFFLNIYERYKKGIGLFIVTFIISALVIYFYLFTFILNHKYILNFSSYLEIIFYTDLLTKQLIDFLFTPIYFSQFGTTINGIFEVIFSTSNKLFEFQIPLVAYILSLSLFMFFKFKHKKFIIISSTLIIIIYMIIILILKIQIENLHLSAVPRYIGIMILAKYLFLISLIIFFNKSLKKYILLFLLFSLFLITPKKTLGFFVSDEIYYSNSFNYDFKKNREKISVLGELKNDFDEVIVIHKKNYSDKTNISVAGYHTFYHNIIEYELFPKKTNFIEYEKFLKNEKTLLTKKNSLIILFDLTTMEISKIDNSNKFFKINTY